MTCGGGDDPVPILSHHTVVALLDEAEPLLDFRPELGPVLAGLRDNHRMRVVDAVELLSDITAALRLRY